MGGNMRLRNKKTGEIVDTKDYNFKIATPAEPLYGHDSFDVREEYDSLAQLNEEWEDYKPTEPLIKDEKIRKAVRAWAVAESEDCYYGIDDTTLKNGSGDHIEFWSRPFKDLTSYEHYTIAELCGEEEE